MKRFIMLCIALLLFSIVAIGCDRTSPQQELPDVSQEEPQKIFPPDYRSDSASNGLMENASPGTSVLSLYVYDGENTHLSTLSTPQSVNILTELDTVKATKVDNWSLNEITMPIYGLSIEGKDGYSLYAAWSNGYWITQGGDIYRFEYDFERLENNYSWSGGRDFSGITVMPCAYYLTKDEKGWNSTLLTPSEELTSPIHITMTLISWSNNTVNVSIANNSGAEWSYGEDFIIQVSIDGVWYSIPTVPGNWGFTSNGLTIQDGKQQNKTYHLTMYGELPAGVYRLVTYGLSVEGVVP